MARGDDKNDRVVRLLAQQLGVTEEKVRFALERDGFRDFAADSLDMVELVMELEEEMSDGFDETP